MMLILDIKWDVTAAERYSLPRFVGPFDSEPEARDWAGLNIPNGLWQIRDLAYPYARNRICTECGNDLACEGYDLCSECLESS